MSFGYLYGVTADGPALYLAKANRSTGSWEWAIGANGDGSEYIHDLTVNGSGVRAHGNTDSTSLAFDSTTTLTNQADGFTGLAESGATSFHISVDSDGTWEEIITPGVSSDSSNSIYSATVQPGGPLSLIHI